MLKIPQEEYEPLKAFITAWLELMGLPPGSLPEHHPVAIIEKLAMTSPARARAGLATVIKDLVEWASDLTAAQIEAIDRDFSARGIVTVSELLTRYSRKRRGSGSA